MEKKKVCFVIMPFSSTKSHKSEEWTEIFENVHSPAIIESGLGYDCQRSNIRPGSFIKDILTNLNQADIVLADLTDRNPNVFYELGVRHTLKNRTILVSKSMDDVPSDLKQYGVIIYSTTPRGVVEYKKKIIGILNDIIDNPERPDNPVSDFLHLETIVTDTFEAKSVEKKLIALVSECSYNLYVIDHIQKDLEDKNNTFSYYRFQYTALEILISTYYIYPNVSFFKDARFILLVLGNLNYRLNLLKDKSFSYLRKETLGVTLEFKEPLIDFMKKTSETLKNFRNQNFIEAKEMTICVMDDEHKKYID